MKNYLTVKELKELLDIASGGDDTRIVKINGDTFSTNSRHVIGVKSKRPNEVVIDIGSY